MFRFEVYCDDKKLSYVLWALQGHCLQVSTPQPVVNAHKKNGQVRAKTSGDRVEMLMTYLKENKLKEFGPSVAGDWAESVGLVRSTYSNVLMKALKAKLLTRRVPKGNKGGEGSGFIYTVKGA